MVALLVSTSMMSWSAWTESPTWTSRLTTVASAMDSPSWGMMIGIEGMGQHYGVDVLNRCSARPEQARTAASHVESEIRNPNTETRKKSEIRNLKSERPAVG